VIPPVAGTAAMPSANMARDKIIQPQLNIVDCVVYAPARSRNLPCCSRAETSRITTSDPPFHLPCNHRGFMHSGAIGDISITLKVGSFAATGIPSPHLPPVVLTKSASSVGASKQRPLCPNVGFGAEMCEQSELSLGSERSLRSAIRSPGKYA